MLKYSVKLVKHLISRGLSPELYHYHTCYSTNKITFLLTSLSGSIVGYQHYRPLIAEKKKKNNPKTGRYFTYLPGETIGVFGYAQINPLLQDLYIVEGLFKAGNLHRLGFNSIAVLTATPSPKMYNAQFKILSQKYNLIGIGDPDPAGEKLVKFVGRGMTSPADIDEMSDAAILEFINEIKK